MKIIANAQISTIQNIMGQIQAEWRGQCSVITVLYRYGLQGIIASEEAWLKDGKETWKRLIMARTALDSSF